MNTFAPDTVADLNMEHLYRNYRMAVFNVCYAYTKSRDEANDLTQETFVKAYLGLAGFEGRSQPKTWLIRIAINQSLTRVLANKRVQRNLDAYLQNEAREQSYARDDLPTSKLGMEEVLKRADIVTRKVLLLAFQQGLTHSEIAKTLGVSRVAVTRRISRFKKMASQHSGVVGKSPKGISRSRTNQEDAWVRESSAYRTSPLSRFQEANAG